MKTYYGMSAAGAAARAPFTVIYRDRIKWPFSAARAPLTVISRDRIKWPFSAGEGDPVIHKEYTVCDKYGDRAWPIQNHRDEAECTRVAEELNLVAAGWLMKNELSQDAYASEVNRYYKPR
jgi:hypothetical protein